MEWKHTDTLVKKKFWVPWSLKKVKLTVFCAIKEIMNVDFLEKDATVNRTSYCQRLRQNLSNETRINLPNPIILHSPFCQSAGR